MKSMFAIGLAFTSLLSMFNSIFDGKVVAKLPFTPVSWIQGLSHRNLMGHDYTDCSFIFLYILCTMSIRQNIQKALGFAPSRAASKQTSMWTPDPNKYKWWNMFQVLKLDKVVQLVSSEKISWYSWKYMIFLDAIVLAGLFIENNRNTYITILFLSYFSYNYKGHCTYR